MAKSPQAFRTIREVAEWLDIPAHVLRFWESKFSQIKPVKRAGGRRYYRPEDMRLIGGLKVLLHDQGHTIRAAQKVLRTEGMAHVVALSPPLDLDEPIESIATRDATERPTRRQAQPAATGLAGIRDLTASIDGFVSDRGRRRRISNVITRLEALSGRLRAPAQS